MRRAQNNTLSRDKVRSTTGILRALAHPLRLQLLGFIDQEKMVNVNTIYTELGLEQSVTSQHLRILRVAGLVKPERQGKFIYYVVDYQKVSEAARLSGIISEFAEQPSLPS